MHGLRVLVVEEEYLVAADIEETLRTAGAEVTIKRDAEEARALDLSVFDFAVIEAKFGSPAALALSNALRTAGIGVVVTSADRAVQSLFTGAIPLQKPFDSTALLAACDAAATLRFPSSLT